MLDLLLDTLSWVIFFSPGLFVTFVLSGLRDTPTIIVLPLPHHQNSFVCSTVPRRLYQGHTHNKPLVYPCFRIPLNLSFFSSILLPFA